MFSKVKVASAAALLTLSVGAQANIIDLFTDPAVQKVETAAVGTTDFDQAGSFPSIIGGYRSLEIEVTSNPDPLINDASLAVSGGSLFFNSDTGVVAKGTVQWDGTESTSTLDRDGMGGQNLVFQPGCPTLGCDRFIFDVQSSDHDFNFTIGLYTDDDNWTEFDLVATQGTHTSEIFFSFFENAGGCGFVSAIPNPGNGVLAQRCGAGSKVVDVKDIGAIQLIFNIDGTSELDFKIGAVTKTGIPEPSMVALLGLGLASSGLVSIRRRRKEKALLAA